MNNNKIDIFNDGKSFVRLVDYVGDELAIVNAARVSLHNESEYEEVFDPNHTEIMHDFRDAQDGIPKTSWVNAKKKLSDKDKGLINFLLRSEHGSPFEQGFMAQFHVRLPIVVMREWVRHRVGFSVNEESGRYVKMRPDFYYPDHLRVQKGKVGEYYFERVDDENLLLEYLEDLIEVNKLQWKYYEKWLDNGIAKEQARLFLGLNLYTEIRWTCNARSLMNFLKLRNAPTAMHEIREYADVIEDIFAQEMPTVWQAFVDNGRIAP
jgi:thymidylate synthase (FAD)